MNMAKEKNILSSTGFLTRIIKGIGSMGKSLFKRKILLIGAVLLVIGFFLINGGIFKKKKVDGNSKPIVKSVAVDRSFDFPALTNQGKTSPTKIKFKITNVEKTNQVLVKEQIYTAKNNKTFLIAAIELKNDASVPLNIVPGDLVRMTYNNDEDNKYAPDLHNNMVMVSAISTKLERLGFVIPEDVKQFKLYVGELEGKKEVITVNIPS
jgi:hypothetical protein